MSTSGTCLIHRARHRPAHLIRLLGCTLVAACQSYEPKPLHPEDQLGALRSVTLADLRIEHAEPGGQATAAPRFDLRDGLDEAELIAVALTLNPSLRARRHELGEAQALLVQAGLWPNPELGVDVRQGISGTPAIGVGADLLFGLLRPDERPAKEALAGAKLDQTRAEITAEEFRLAAAVRRARLAVLAADQTTRQLTAEAQLRDDAVALVRTQRALGEATELALTQVELDRTGIQRELREAHAAFARERMALNQLLGLPAAYEIPLTGLGEPLRFTLAPDLDDRELEHRVVAGRFDLRARAAAYEAAEAGLRLAVARQFPALRLGPSYEKDIEGTQGLGLGLSLDLPLFDRNQAEIQERSAARERARAEYVAALHDRLAEAFLARAALRQARDEVELQQRDVLPLIERTDALFAGALRSRDVTMFEWIAARSRSLQARRALLDALLRHASAVIELEATTGAPLTAPPRPTEHPETSR